MRAVEISLRAQHCVERIDTRWRKKADHPDIFRTEMDEVIEHLGSVSSPGTPFPTKKRPHLKRVLLEKSKCHVYFVINESKQCGMADANDRRSSERRGHRPTEARVGSPEGPTRAESSSAGRVVAAKRRDVVTRLRAR